MASIQARARLVAAASAALLLASGPASGEQAAAPDASVRVVAWGDSITYGGGAADPATQSWPARIGAITAATPGACLVTTPCMGRTRPALDLFDRQVLSRRPDVVVIGYGVNDLVADTPPRAIVAGYREAVRRARAAGAQVLVLGITPDRMFGVNAAGFDDLRRRMNRQLERAFPRQYVGFDAFLAGRDGLLAPRFDSGDGLHLNAAAYRIMAREIRHGIEALLARGRR